MEVVITYGVNVMETLKNFKIKCKKEIEQLTAMNVEQIDIIAKGIYIPEK